MIEKIIIQDSMDVQSVWIPDRRSMASFAIWKAYGLGHHAHWLDGRITLGVNADEDMKFFYEFPGHMEEGSFPAWVDPVIERIDASLPSAAAILKSLDADTLSIPIDPPAYRIPYSPSPEDVATCLLATRLLLSVRSALVPPMEHSIDMLAAELEFASRIAVLLGGEAAASIARMSAADASLCEILPDPNADDDLILTGAQDA